MEQILEIKKKYFPEKSLSQVMQMVQAYYKADISAWSDDKLAAAITKMVSDSSVPKESDIVFNPLKAKWMQIVFADNESIAIPVSQVEKLFIDKESQTGMFENDGHKDMFETSKVIHSAESIVVKFKEDNTYKIRKGSLDMGSGNLTSLLKKSVLGIKCIYPDGKYSYSIRPKWEGNGSNNLLQTVKSEYGGIVLYLGDYARL